MVRFLRLAVASACLCLSAAANAHFVWIVQTGSEVQIHFSESAESSEPDLLKNIVAAKAWSVVSGGRGGVKLTEIPLTLTESSLSGQIDPGSTAVVLSHNYGVVSKGDTPFLLRYFAKQHVSPLPGQWSAVKNEEHLPLEVTPSWNGREVVLTVTWKGQPAAGVEVKVGGCGIEETLVADAGGIVRCSPASSGTLSVRAKMVEASAGESDGKAYDSIRTYSTLTLPFTLPTVRPAAHSIPELPRAVTSFGAAIAGEYLYVYGGHFGDAHHYSDSGQSGEFRRVRLGSEKPEWESLPGGPKLTGLALVEYKGRLYRVGGFTAKNSDDEDQNLWSQDSFAAYDPGTGAWTTLPPLPSGRSSHDAAVVDGKLYVVGGWNMAGADSTTWHTSALVCDLNQSDLKWTELPAPGFERRAVSLAAYKGRLYVIGGMTSDNRTIRNVSIFDPATQTWSDGPELLGTGMEGFGTSSFASGEHLVVTTMSGAVQTLSEDGSRWTVAGQTAEARFFHRQLTAADDRIVLIAGASMSSGKTATVEFLQFEKR